MSAISERGAESGGRRTWLLAAAVALAAAVPATAGAQGVVEEGVRVEVGPAYGTLVGDDFDAVGRGYGGELQVRRYWRSGWSVGLAGRYTSHESEGVDDRLDLFGAVVAPRRIVASDALPFDPVFGARVGAARWQLTANVAGISADFAANGLEFGGTVGARFGVTDAIAFELRALASLVTFDDVSGDLGGQQSLFEGGSLPESGTLGGWFGVHGALSLPSF